MRGKVSRTRRCEDEKGENEFLNFINFFSSFRDKITQAERFNLHKFLMRKNVLASHHLVENLSAHLKRFVDAKFNHF
jgi:hypothetical protein